MGRGDGNIARESANGIRWSELADGRLRRFKRGRHYFGPPETTERDAEQAARDLEKVAVTVKDQLGKTEYLWVQFLDGTLRVGQPCPRCQGTNLARWQEYFVRCYSCHAVHRLMTSPEGVPDKHQVARRHDFRLVSRRGEPVEEIAQWAGFVAEARCDFFRPVPGVHFGFLVFAGGRRFLRANLPDILAVPAAQTVQITMEVPAGLLEPGLYQFQSLVRYSLDELDEESFVSLPRSDQLPLTVTDTQATTPAGPTHLRWEVRSLNGGGHLPVVAPPAWDDEGEGD